MIFFGVVDRVLGDLDHQILPRHDGLAARARFHQQRSNAFGGVHHHAHGQRMEQQLRAAGHHQLVGRHLERRVVVGLRRDAPAKVSKGLRRKT